MKKNYMDEFDPPYTPLLVIKEAARCLLCHDAPCSQACPAEADPAKFIRSVHFRNFKGAAETIRENNALGSLCARICPTENLCQEGCSRSGIDKPIEIGMIQRFVTDFEEAAQMQILKPGSKKLGKVAVIGSGPAGLQASVTLNDLGYEVNVYEKEKELGGWLRSGIPQFYLPNKLVDTEINRIKDLGIHFVNKTEVGKDISLDQLKQDHKAVLLAVGASYGSTLPMFENNEHVERAVDFLARAKANGGKIDIPASAIVIGGGDVAMDAATTLKMLGCASVTCVTRKELHEFRATQHKLHNAQEMNVSIFDGYAPTAVQGNRVTFKHSKLGSEMTLVADKIIVAVGQFSKLEPFQTVSNEHGIVQTNTYQTSDPQVFAAGDIIKGDKTVVFGVKSGKEAARAIHQFLEGEK